MENFLTLNGLASIFKLYGTVMMIALAVSLVVAVVLIMRFPRSHQEWVVGLICTIVSS
ncbi:hypothetical protein WAJ21_21540, partial [Acinetobacter baumannii]